MKLMRLRNSRLTWVVGEMLSISLSLSCSKSLARYRLSSLGVDLVGVGWIDLACVGWADLVGVTDCVDWTDLTGVNLVGVTDCIDWTDLLDCTDDDLLYSPKDNRFGLFTDVSLDWLNFENSVPFCSLSTSFNFSNLSILL